MNTIKIVTSYLLGLIFVHLIIIPDSPATIIPMFLSMGLKINESLSELLHVYIGGSLATCLMFYLLTRKKINKLFLYCWLVIGVIIILFYSYDISEKIDNVLCDSFLGSVYIIYNSYYFGGAFTYIWLYFICQLSVLLLYLFIKLLKRILIKVNLYKYLSDNKQDIILTVKCIVSYLVGLMIIHFIPSGREYYLELLKLMTKLVGNAGTGQCILFYIMGSAFTYISYNLLVRRKLPSLFFKCWFAGFFLIVFASIFLVPIDNYLSTSCLNGLVERYNRLHDGGSLLTVFSFYTLCQLFVLCLYRVLKSKR